MGANWPHFMMTTPKLSPRALNVLCTANTFAINVYRRVFSSYLYLTFFLLLFEEKCSKGEVVASIPVLSHLVW